MHNSRNTPTWRRISDIAFKTANGKHTHTHIQTQCAETNHIRWHQYLQMHIGGFAVIFAAAAVTVRLMCLFILFGLLSHANLKRAKNWRAVSPHQWLYCMNLYLCVNIIADLRACIFESNVFTSFIAKQTKQSKATKQKKNNNRRMIDCCNRLFFYLASHLYT